MERGFAMPQMPSPMMNNNYITDAQSVYAAYSIPAGTKTLPKDKIFYAFQTNTDNGELPKAIVAHRVTKTKKSKEIVEANSFCTTIPYESYALDSIDNTFLLYVSKPGMTDEVDPIFGPIEQAAASFTGREYFIYYSVAWTVLSKKQPGKTIPAFLTMCVPCTVSTTAAKNILHKEKLGIVEPVKGAVVLDRAVTTRTELIEKYASMITCHSFCSECKLSADELNRIDSKIRSVFEGCYLVKRVTESTGAVQIVQSPRIKIGARFGEARLAHKIRNFRMSMVFQMPYKSPQQKATIFRMCRAVIFSIIAKVKDTKYQEGIMALPDNSGSAWTAHTAKKYLIKLLDVYYFCYHLRIMHSPINSDRVDALREGIFTWKQFFENQKVIPKKSTWDQIERRREVVTRPIVERVYTLADESTDEEGDAKSSEVRKNSRAVSEPPESE
jgi:hypothetical protein